MQHNGGSGGGCTGGGVFGPRGRRVLGMPTVEHQVFGGGPGPGQVWEHEREHAREHERQHEREREREHERDQEGNANVNGMVDYDLIDSLLDFTAAEIEVEPLLFDHHSPPGITQVEVTSSALPNADGTPYFENRPEENSFQCDDITGPDLEWLSNFMDQCFSPQDIDITTKPAASDGSSSYSGKASEDCDGDKQKGIITAANNLLANLQCQSTSPSSVLDRRSNKNQQVLVDRGSGGGVVESGAPFCFTWPFKLQSPSSSDDTQSKDTTIAKPNQLFHSSVNRGRGRAPRTKRPQKLSKRPLHDGDEMKPKKLKMDHSSPMGSPPTLNPATAPATATLPTINPPPGPATPPVPLRANDVSKRKCMHCEAQTTPQWRAGPRGPKTLCNACGVRYKSGRLFPEYRPSASPTYVESIHSNSHKKVVELRGKNSRDSQNTPVSAKGCELLYYIKSR